MSGRVLALVSKIHLDWKRRVARDLAPHGISPKQIFILRRLREAGGLAPSQVAVLLHGDRPSATSMIDTLQRAGWVARRKDPANRRHVIVELTDAGAAKLASVPERLWRSGRTELDPESCLSSEERRTLIALLERVHSLVAPVDTES